MATTTTTAQAHVALARNLLSSVLALAFPDNLVTDEAAQAEFLTQLPQLRSIFEQHNVFAVVTDGKAFDKFISRLLLLIDTAHGVDRALKAAAFQLLLIVAEQCPLETLESLTPQLGERILKMTKYLKDAPLVAAAACDLARVTVRNIELYSPEARRDLHESLTKLLPALLSLLSDLSSKSDFGEDDLALFTSVVCVFNELLEVAPSAVRSSQSKLEAAVAAIALYNQSIASTPSATDAAAGCLALLSNASDKSHHVWKQLVDKAVEFAHQLLDPIAGRRVVTATPPTGMKVWLRGTDGATAAADLEALAVYQRMNALLQRLNLVVRVLEESVGSRAVSEREVQLVLGDLIALARRFVAVRAQEVGKQSAISEDGVRLPLSVVYGALPRVHALGLRCLSAVVARAGLCALRHGGKIARTLLLACENLHAEAHGELFHTVSVCVRVLGASTLERMGQPLLLQLVTQCKYDLEEAGKAKPSDDAAKTQALEARGKNAKGKKRKRHVGDLSQLSLDAGSSGGALSFLSARDQRVLVGNVDAALAAIATCVAVYGGLLNAETRAQASAVALLAAQLQPKRRLLPAAPRGSGADDSVAWLLLADAASADASGAHATNLMPSVGFWSTAATLAQVVALNVGEALLHPRGPPLSINLEQAIQAQSSVASGVSGFLGLTSQAKRQQQSASRAKAPAAVRGQLDWEREEPKEEVEEAVDAKRVKTEEDEAMEEVQEEQQVVEEEDDDDEDYDDERPGEVEQDEDMDTTPTVTKQETVAAAVNDDDDDEFPDIVDGDDEDDE